ncbi:hypothetical protein ABIB15_000645 [Marisediminicola sp. UYEF4]|uniref:hypothetical protein n=1 Tax=Marisediminicola sp. UYEF4 TaxID=1756384 RepID=UPI003393C60E
MAVSLRLLSIGLVAASSLGLASCGAVPIRLGPSAPAPDSSVTEFCSDFTLAGGDASTVGPLELSLPKDQLHDKIRVKLEIMNGLEPPVVIAQVWANYEAYFTRAQLALADQVSGAALHDDDVIQTGLELYPQSRIVRNFYLTNCAAKP